MEMEMEKNEENKSTEEKQTGSICGYNSLQHLLSENLNPHLYKAVKFSADKELLREPRVVRVNILCLQIWSILSIRH
ncbi:hypothetical protein V6N13_124278 [Hibiscus sabdariffa]